MLYREVVFSTRQSFPGVASVLQAELLAILFCLEVVKHEGIRAEYVEFDSAPSNERNQRSFRLFSLA